MMPLLLFAGCAYKLGNPDRALPLGYTQISVPIFQNKTMEPGLEVSFTNALIQEFERSRVGKLVDKNQAEAVLEGSIREIKYVPGGKKETGLPQGSILATSYDITVVVSLQLKRLSDNKILWSGDFTRSRSYIAPQVTLPTINTVNPLYNLSARRQNFDILALDMMAEAHDRITENF